MYANRASVCTASSTTARVITYVSLWWTLMYSHNRDTTLTLVNFVRSTLPQYIHYLLVPRNYIYYLTKRYLSLSLARARAFFVAAVRRVACYVNYLQSHRHYLHSFTVRRLKRPERKIGDTILMVVSNGCSKEWFVFIDTESLFDYVYLNLIPFLVSEFLTFVA